MLYILKSVIKTVKLNLLFLIISLLGFNSYSQISFEKGYIIDNSDTKTECLIKNMDWNNNPSEIKYKLDENAEIKTGTLNSIQEFGIYNTAKFIKSDVDIDISSENKDHLSRIKDPVFEQKEIFLRVIIEGKANLYTYKDYDITRYFYNLDNSKIEQLIFKKYKISDYKIKENVQFKQQLWNNFKCESISINQIRKLKYQKEDLLNFFISFNSCQKSEYTVHDKKKKRDLFNLAIRPRINSSKLSIQNSLIKYKNSEFSQENNFGIGLEAEIILPFNKNKWSFFIEPTYQYFKSKSSKETDSYSLGDITTTVNYQSIELPIGLRHYFFLNDSSKLFINAAFVFDFSLNNSITSFKYNGSTNIDDFTMRSMENFAIGAGYKFKDKYSIEFRYFTNRHVLRDYVHWKSEYKTASFIIGYSFL